LARYVLVAAFVVAGSLHFLYPSTYARIVPPTFGHAKTLVYVSGVCEILGGFGVLLSPLRKAAGVGLIALLIAVFPANLYMALHPALFATIASPVALDARLPLQAVLIAWVYWCCF
jgi:uncharacterized membrane protein